MQESAMDKKAERPPAEQSIKRNSSVKPENEQAGEASSPIALLKADHRKVEQILEEFEKAKSRDKRMQCVKEVARELIIHAKLEEEIFYPACRDALEDDEPLDEAQVEHDTIKVLLADLLRQDREGPYFKAKVTVLKEYVKHHVREEEESNDSIFAKAKKAGLDEQDLATKLAERKGELQEQYAGEDLEPPTPIAFEAQPTGKEHLMRNESRGQRDRNEDDRRYSSRGDDDRYDRERSSNSGGRSRGRSEEDDEPFRDSMGRLHHADGRFMSEDDEDEYNNSRRGRSSSSRDQDDDRSSSRSRGRSGGDDNERSGGRSQSSSSRYNDDDDRRSSRSGGGRPNDDDGRDGPFRDSMGRMHRSDGRFMSEDEDDRGSRRSRSRDDEDDRDQGSRSRNEGSGRRYNNDRHYAEDRGQGGYFGDPEGHRRNAMGQSSRGRDRD